VTVPAGTFDAYRLEITPTDGADKKTLWVDRTRGSSEGVGGVASMGGAVVTRSCAVGSPVKITAGAGSRVAMSKSRAAERHHSEGWDAALQRLIDS